jgi:luciferase-type oxidoreductase
MSGFPKINSAYNQVFNPGKLSLGLFFAIESYSGSIPLMRDQVVLAQRAEKLGFSALWFRDVPLSVPNFGDAGQIYDPWVYMGYIAAQTRKINLVTGSIILNLRHPIHLAKAAASLDQLTNGRLVLGVASGDRPVEYPAFGKNIQYKEEIFRESFSYIRRLNEKYPVINSMHGNMYGDTDLIPKATGNRLPMMVTGHSGQSLEWIAANADGWIYYPRNLQMQAQSIATWRELLKTLKQPDKPFAQSLYIDLADTPEFLPVPIHLGYKIGRKHLAELLHTMESNGVNHVVLNLKYGSRPAAEVMEEIGEYILPQFL